MTEYMDYLNEGQDITITFKQGIISGALVEKQEAEFKVLPRHEDERYTVRHVGGALTSEDDTDEWPEYEIEVDGEFVPVQDVRGGHYSTGGNPNLEADDRGHKGRGGRFF